MLEIMLSGPEAEGSEIAEYPIRLSLPARATSMIIDIEPQRRQ